MTDVATPPAETSVRPNRLSEFWFYFRENRGAVIGLWIFAGFAFLALFGQWITPHDPTQQYRAFTLIGFLLGIQLLFGLLFGGSNDWVADLFGFITGFFVSFLLVPGALGRIRDKLRQRG